MSTDTCIFVMKICVFIMFCSIVVISLTELGVIHR